mmetsp:Transcript_115443/g.322708  ORF Transcript_115443/g.322708 Transcript_115443/m.322708 type:complete len:334 (-) Transcript_115443:378-1379(-)
MVGRLLPVVRPLEVSAPLDAQRSRGGVACRVALGRDPGQRHLGAPLDVHPEAPPQPGGPTLRGPHPGVQHALCHDPGRWDRGRPELHQGHRLQQEGRHQQHDEHLHRLAHRPVLVQRSPVQAHGLPLPARGERVQCGEEDWRGLLVVDAGARVRPEASGVRRVGDLQRRRALRCCDPRLEGGRGLAGALVQGAEERADRRHLRLRRVGGRRARGHALGPHADGLRHCVRGGPVLPGRDPEARQRLAGPVDLDLHRGRPARRQHGLWGLGNAATGLRSAVDLLPSPHEADRVVHQAPDDPPARGQGVGADVPQDLQKSRRGLCWRLRGLHIRGH